jgi:hypothetical protein
MQGIAEQGYRSRQDRDRRLNDGRGAEEPKGDPQHAHALGAGLHRGIHLVRGLVRVRPQEMPQPGSQPGFRVLVAVAVLVAVIIATVVVVMAVPVILTPFTTAAMRIAHDP